MGYKQGMKVKKSLSIIHSFGYPIEKSAEIFEIWRLENQNNNNNNNNNFLSLFEKEISHPKNKTLICGGGEVE